ncbi:type IV pilus assembly PilZ [Legionella beliardensis]|uniref:Type IV pilus assembly PilZ n=1 Tax=Legionella beliardensis TaxID=91822 RepID=A0A378I0N7_9GAMM|nr:PilZ domain-containing protein [Legionella beliardensis]STX28311.1 type IV pilus assembly PilZ [Legionella beliardensis]
MPVHERRQHFRIDDEIYFEYKIIESETYSDKSITDELLGHSGQRYLETTRYFQSLDYELSKLTQSLALKEPAIAHYLNLLNAKIDYLMRHLSIAEKTPKHKVNISLGGMAFHSKQKIKEKTLLKLIIYTKPKMIPIIVNAIVVYSQYVSNHHYRTAVQFESLTAEQEQLLSQHIMLAQVQCRLD